MTACGGWRLRCYSRPSRTFTAGFLSTAAAPRRFIGRREDVDQFWCALVGLDGDAVRERLSEQVPRREEAADTPWSLTTEYATVFLSLRGVALRLEVARSPPRGAPSGPRPVGKCGTEANDHHSCDGRDPEPHNPPSLRRRSLGGPASTTRHAYDMASRLRRCSDVLATLAPATGADRHVPRAVTLVLNVRRRRSAGIGARRASVQVNCRVNSLIAGVVLSAALYTCNVRCERSGRRKYRDPPRTVESRTGEAGTVM